MPVLAATLRRVCPPMEVKMSVVAPPMSIRATVSSRVCSCSSSILCTAAGVGSMSAATIPFRLL